MFVAEISADLFAAITKALKQLGFTVYDSLTRMWNGDLARWQPLLRAKVQGNQAPLDRSSLYAMTNEFDVSQLQNILDALFTATDGVKHAFEPKLTRSIEQSISDSPCFFMVEELAQAYPRDPDSAQRGRLHRQVDKINPKQRRSRVRLELAFSSLRLVRPVLFRRHIGGL